MNRRRLLAGVAGVGVIGGGWAINRRSPLAGDDESATFSVDTIDAAGSTAGTLTVPGERPTLVDFISVGCSVCRESMPALAAAHATHGESVQFVSLSTDPVGFSVEKSELRAWWDTHDGAWPLGVDRQLAVAEQLGVDSVPTAVVIDEQGHVRGRASGRKTREKLDTLLDPVV